jgi:hypothetical protein
MPVPVKLVFATVVLSGSNRSTLIVSPFATPVWSRVVNPVGVVATIGAIQMNPVLPGPFVWSLISGADCRWMRVSSSDGPASRARQDAIAARP